MIKRMVLVSCHEWIAISSIHSINYKILNIFSLTIFILFDVRLCWNRYWRARWCFYWTLSCRCDCKQKERWSLFKEIHQVRHNNKEDILIPCFVGSGAGVDEGTVGIANFSIKIKKSSYSFYIENMSLMRQNCLITHKYVPCSGLGVLGSGSACVTSCAVK